MSEPTLPVTLTRERAPPAEPRTMRRRSSVERFSSVERRASRERSLSVDRGGSVPSIVSRESSRRDEDYLTGRTPDTASELQRTQSERVDQLLVNNPRM